MKVLEAFRKAEGSEELDRKIWKKCFQYVNNRVDGELGQWEQSIKTGLGGKPSLSLPFVGKFVNRISGAQRTTKIDEKVFPRDDLADPITADILTDLLKYVYDLPENQAEWQIARMFRNGVIAGRGWIRLEWNDDNDPMGEISISSVHPRRVYMCGRGDRYDLFDRIGIIEKIPVSKEELEAAYPDKYSEIIAQKEQFSTDTPVAGEDYDFTVTEQDFWDAEEKEYFILRQQRWEWQSVRFLKNPETGKLEEIDFEVKDSDIPPEIEIIKKKMRKVRVMTVCGSVELENEISKNKHGRFDLVPFFPYFDDGVTRGAAQDLLDIQDEKNKRRSQMTHILGVIAKGNYFIKKGAFDNPTEFAKKVGGTGQIIEVNTTGSINDSVQPIRPDLTLFPALAQMDGMSSNESREISGLSDASLGNTTPGVKSGIAIQSLQMPTETIIGEIVENYLETRRTLAQMTVSLIQQYYTGERKVRILGDYTKDFVPEEVQDMYDALKKQIMTINPIFDEAMAGDEAAKMIDLQSGAKVVTINKQYGDQRLNDITAGRFDVVIDHVSQNPTTRRGLLFDLMNLRSQGVPIPNKTLVEYSDIRNKRKVMAEMENYEQQLMQQAVAEELKKQGGGSSPTQDNGGLNSGGSQMPML